MNGEARDGAVPLLSTRGLEHRFSGPRVLDDVSLTISPGELLVALGPNGAGKTTLLRVLSGVLIPDAGAVELEGRPVGRLSRREIARRVAVVPQDTAVPFPFRVFEIVAMGRSPHMGPLGHEGPSDRDAVERALQTMGLFPIAERRFQTLSGGERQRVLFARALAQEPRVLLLDEPTAHMDLGHRLFVFESLRQWIDEGGQGRAALVVTHDLGLASRFADGMILLDRGRVVASGAPSDVLQPDRIASVYAADVQIARDDVGRPVVVALRSRIRYSARPDGSNR
jgi:iron complex transport system ATP-binding protein